MPEARELKGSSHGTPDPRGERSRAAALQAARALLAEMGWEGVTHLRVANRSGLGRATIYRHWPDPETLRREAMAEEVRVFHTVPTGDLRADLLAELEGMRHELMERGQAQVMATLINQSERDPEMCQFKVAVVREGCSTLRDLIEKALAQGYFNPRLDPDDATAELVGPMLFRRLLVSADIAGSLSRPLWTIFVHVGGVRGGAGPRAW